MAATKLSSLPQVQYLLHNKVDSNIIHQEFITNWHKLPRLLLWHTTQMQLRIHAIGV